MQTEPLLLTVPEVCAMLRIGRTTAYRLISENRLRVSKIGKATRITMESVRAVARGEGTDASNDNGDAK